MLCHVLIKIAFWNFSLEDMQHMQIFMKYNKK
jgi:hypothetical protein